MSSAKKKLIGHIGHDADNPNAGDAAFYDWIVGSKEAPLDTELFLWLLDDLKNETDTESVRALLQQWKKDCDAAEFETRIKLLAKILPPAHPFNALNLSKSVS